MPRTTATNRTTRTTSLTAGGRTQATNRKEDDLVLPTTNLVLLLNANKITGNDGDSISSFLDESGNGYHATQGNASNQPILKTGSNGINGKKVLRFSGNQFMTNSSFPSLGTGAWTAYIVIKRTTNHSYYATFFSLGHPTYNAIFSITPSYEYVLNAAGSGSNQIFFGTSTLDTPTIIRGRSLGSGTYRLTTNPFMTEGSNSPPITCSAGYLLGNWSTTGDQPYYGDIALVAVYNVNLSSGDRTTVQNAIASYYGI